MIPEFEISECPEFEVSTKIGNIFLNEKILEEYSVKAYKIGSYFYEHYKEKIQVDKHGRKYILFRIHVYFTQIFQLQKLIKKNMPRKTLFLRRKTKIIRKKTWL